MLVSRVKDFINTSRNKKNYIRGHHSIITVQQSYEIPTLYMLMFFKKCMA